MSLFAALTTAVGGLAAQSVAIGNVSDNLANTQTTGYKGIDTQFESLVTQSTQTINDPGGVRATPNYQNGVQGSLVSASSSTSLAISGQGFFPVRAGIVNADGTTSIGTTPYYTRAGDFSLDKNGYLINGAGYYLTGWSVDNDGVVDTSHTSAIMLSALLDNPVATDAASYSANLPAGVESTLASPFTSSPSTVLIYDAFGGTHNLSFTWEKAASDANGTAYYSIGDNITFRSNFSGTIGNSITITIENGTNPNTYKATVHVDGGTDEVFDNIGGTGNTFWINFADAINNGIGGGNPSQLITAQAGTGTDVPSLTSYTLAHGSGSTTNGYATATETGCITFTALETGTAGNGITVSIAAGSGPGLHNVTISNGVTNETLTDIGGAGNAFWTNLRDAINSLPSALIYATTGAGTTAPVDGTTYTLSGGSVLPATENLWYLHVSVPGGGGVDPFTGSTKNYTATIPFTFNSASSTGVTAGTIASITAAGGPGSSGTYTVGSGGKATVTLPLDFTGYGVTGGQNITVSFGYYNLASNALTQFADANNTVSVSSFNQNGIPRGSFQSLSIDKNGFVSLNYDNGQNRIIAQIPIVQFFAQDRLQRITGGAYAETLYSGTPRVSAPGTNGGGVIVSNSLEASTVDIASEFTKLIQAQRVYSANARTISTADNMLQEVINIIR